METVPAIATRANPFDSHDVELILQERGWLGARRFPGMDEWMRDAADWLGAQAASHVESAEERRERLEELLGLVFSYNAAQLLEAPKNQAVMSREGVRDTIRELANRVLEGGEIDSARLREIIDALKQTFGSQGRRTFHPLRLALAGAAGEGELDRVILLLDGAAKLPFAVRVKGTRERMLEFCAAMR